MEDLIGATVGSYTIVRFIGEGGMGTVWLGKHATIGREVAIKMLHPQYSRNEKIRERFRREATTLARLQHPNIVTLYDYLEVGQHLCLVMEFVEGVTLEALIQSKTGPLPTERLGQIFRQILSAISYAHQQGVIHRDIKPSNFIVSADDTVKVLDFGIAKLLEDDQQLTRTGIRLGTTIYMSPEQVQGQSIDHRSDIYALGVTLFFISTGQRPYPESMSEFEVFTKIVNDPLPLARTIYPWANAAVERAIQVATAKRPRDRFQTVDDFLEYRIPKRDFETKSPAPKEAISPLINSSGDTGQGRDTLPNARSSGYGRNTIIYAVFLFLFGAPLWFIVYPGAVGMLLRRGWGLGYMQGILIIAAVLDAFSLVAAFSRVAADVNRGMPIVIISGLYGVFISWGLALVFDKSAYDYYKKKR